LGIENVTAEFIILCKGLKVATNKLTELYFEIEITLAFVLGIKKKKDKRRNN
jgi:hypothetical protein